MTQGFAIIMPIGMRAYLYIFVKVLKINFLYKRKTLKYNRLNTNTVFYFSKPLLLKYCRIE